MYRASTSFISSSCNWNVSCFPVAYDSGVSPFAKAFFFLFSALVGTRGGGGGGGGCDVVGSGALEVEGSACVVVEGDVGVGDDEGGTISFSSGFLFFASLGNCAFSALLFL